MAKINLADHLKHTSYPGRGIILGLAPDGNQAVAAYFIMGRSENSRNRVFIADGAGLRTQAYDPSKMRDPSLIIYAPVYLFEDWMIVSNGDQSDTIRLGLLRGKSFEESLAERTFEPDAPHYTPRISGLLHFKPQWEKTDGVPVWYELSILKANLAGKPEGSVPSTAPAGESDGSVPSAEPSCIRRFWQYRTPQPGCGHFISTYQNDGDPLPSFEGEPYGVEIPPTADECAELLWNSLHPENKVALFVRYLDMKERTIETVIRNAREEEPRRG